MAKFQRFYYTGSGNLFKTNEECLYITVNSNEKLNNKVFVDKDGYWSTKVDFNDIKKYGYRKDIGNLRTIYVHLDKIWAQVNGNNLQSYIDNGRMVVCTYIRCGNSSFFVSVDSIYAKNGVYTYKRKSVNIDHYVFLLRNEILWTDCIPKTTMENRTRDPGGLRILTNLMYTYEKGNKYCFSKSVSTSDSSSSSSSGGGGSSGGSSSSSSSSSSSDSSSSDSSSSSSETDYTTSTSYVTQKTVELEECVGGSFSLTVTSGGGSEGLSVRNEYGHVRLTKNDGFELGDDHEPEVRGEWKNCPAKTAPKNPEQRQEYYILRILDFFLDKGLTVDAACAIVANSMSECCPDFRASQDKVNDGVGLSFGLFMFYDNLGKTKSQGAFPGLVSYCKEHNKSIVNIDAQMEFVWHEIQNSTSYRPYKTVYFNGNVPGGIQKVFYKDLGKNYSFEQMVESFLMGFEKPGKNNSNQRVEKKSKIYETYQKYKK